MSAGYAAPDRSPVRIVPALLRGAAVFAGFGLYAGLSPVTYEAEAVVSVDGLAAPGADPAAEVARAHRIRDVALEPNATARVVVEPLDGATFRIVVEDRDRARALEVCSKAVERAVREAGRVLVGQARDFTAEHELAAFVAAHPEPKLPALAPSAAKPEVDKSRLEAERAQLRAQIARLEAQARDTAESGDNPYGSEVTRPNTGLLRRRLIEIESKLASVQRVDDTLPAVEAAPELATLFAGLQRAPAAAPVSLRTVRPASAATSPVRPRRSLLLLLGGVAALLAAVMPALRRGKTTSPELDASDESPAPSHVETRETRVVPAAVRGEAVLGPPSLQRPRSDPPAVAVTAAEKPRSSAPPPPDSPVLAYPVAWQADATVTPQKYGSLAADLRAQAGDDCLVVLITASTDAAAAKPLVTAGLALALAGDTEARVLAIEADWQRPALHRLLHLDVPPGTDFSEQLNARAANNGSDPRWYVLKCSPSLHVLPTLQHAPDLILSTHFENCVASLRRYYDLILLHGPLTSERVPCRAVDDVVDALVLAVRPGESAPQRGLDVFSPKRFAVIVPAA